MNNIKELNKKISVLANQINSIKIGTLPEDHHPCLIVDLVELEKDLKKLHCDLEKIMEPLNT